MPSRPTGYQQQTSDTRPRAAVGPELGLGGRRAATVGRFGALAQRAQQRALFVDRVACDAVRGQREEDRAIALRIAQQLGAVLQRFRIGAVESRTGRDDRVARLARQAGGVVRGDSQGRGAQRRIQLRGLTAPADVPELEVAPGHFDRGREDRLEAAPERLSGRVRASPWPRPQASRGWPGSPTIPAPRPWPSGSVMIQMPPAIIATITSASPSVSATRRRIRPW